jgi:hydrogenase large subunit
MGLNGGVIVDSAGTPVVTHLLENRAGLVGTPGSLAYAKNAVETNLKEFITRSRYANTHGYSAGHDSAYPGDVTMTEPSRDDSSKYSWMKAPRWNGYAMEVGPFARMVINGKYVVNGAKLVDSTGNAAQQLYAAIYGGTGLTTSLNGIDLRVLDRDLVSGLVGSGDLTVASAVTSWVAGVKGGLSTMDRLRARAIESAWIVALLLGVPAKSAGGVISFPAGSLTDGTNGWVGALQKLGKAGGTVPNFYRDTTPPPGTVSGYGLVEAPRGALGHFITASSGKINSYQCVVPTTWNGSPKNGATTGGLDPHQNTTTNRGAIEQAMMNVAFDGVAMANSTLHQTSGAVSGVEVLRVAQSFDPCIACAVH